MPTPAPTVTQLTQIISAIGALGVAAFGLVDATKILKGGVNHIGFSTIKNRIEQYIPHGTKNCLSRKEVLDNLQQNWFNGTDLAAQKAIAKSLIKLCFSAETAPTMAKAAEVDAGILAAIPPKVAKQEKLTEQEADVFARFDLILTAQLDATYQRADQSYTNATRGWAMLFAVLLAVAGACVVNGSWALPGPDLGEAIVVGLIATPLAPVAKDLTSALAAAVNAMQAVKKK